MKQYNRNANRDVKIHGMYLNIHLKCFAEFAIVSNFSLFYKILQALILSIFNLLIVLCINYELELNKYYILLFHYPKQSFL